MSEQQYQPVMGERFRVRFSDHSDTDRILSFYDANRHTYVVPREWALMEKRVRLGSEILVENERNQLVASSLAYPHYDTQGDNTHPRWTEFGSTRIVMNGYRLYQLMVAASVVQQFIMEAPTERFFAKIAPDNDKIHHLLGGELAWPRYQPCAAQKLSIYGQEAVAHDDIVMKTLTTCGADEASATVTFNQLRKIPPRMYYECDAPRLAHQAKVILGYFDNPDIERRDSKTGELKGQIQLDFSELHLAGVLRPVVELMANTNFDAQDPSQPQHGMAAVRAAFFSRNRKMSPAVPAPV